MCKACSYLYLQNLIRNCNENSDLLTLTRAYQGSRVFAAASSHFSALGNFRAFLIVVYPGSGRLSCKFPTSQLFTTVAFNFYPYLISIENLHYNALHAIFYIIALATVRMRLIAIGKTQFDKSFFYFH